ncbi:hypothetical protein D4S03_05515 [bacterium]|nr:MAG: hypothetical protein D4S03_05515 [bacterium]
MTRPLISPKFLLLLALVALAWLAITALPKLEVTASTHALFRHGPMALSAQNCFNGSGTIRTAFLDPETGRKASVCEMAGKFFVSIDDRNGNNITMFRRDFARSVRDVADYLRRSGFTARP